MRYLVNGLCTRNQSISSSRLGVKTQRFSNTTNVQRISIQGKVKPNEKFLYGGVALGAAAFISLCTVNQNFKVKNAEAKTEDTDPLKELKDTVSGFFNLETKVEKTSNDEKGKEESKTSGSSDVSEEESGGPGRPVKVNLDPELVEELPVMDLEEVQACNGLTSSDRLLVSYEGIVYDVTEFVNAHPGGKDMILTAAGLDLSHFFNN